MKRTSIASSRPKTRQLSLHIVLARPGVLAGDLCGPGYRGITESFASGDTDYAAQLTRIKALNPDAIFVSALPPEKPGILIQGHQLGLSGPCTHS